MSTDPQGTPGTGEPGGSPHSDPTAPIYDAPTTGAPPAAAAPPPPAPPPPPAAYPSYGQPGYPQQSGYAHPMPAPAAGYPPYGGYAGAEHPKGTLVLVLGILSIVLCSVLGPFAWAQGRTALREIDSSGQPYSNRGQVQAGMICGIIGSVLLILTVLYIVFIIVMVIVAGTSSSVR